MRTRLLILCVALAAGSAACRKKGGTGGGGGGGGGGAWLVGTQGLMADVDIRGRLGAGYDLGESEDLNAIACRYLAEAWVVGSHGTLLYTADGGDSWSSHDVGTTADLRALATQDAGPVFVAGDGVFLVATPEHGTGDAAWTQLGDGATRFRAVAAAQRGDAVLALSDDGGVWSYAGGALARRATVPGARAIALSPDGSRALVAGAGLHASTDGGATWAPLAGTEAMSLEAIGVDLDGAAVAVGAAGLVARIDPEGRVLTQRLGGATLRSVHIKPYGAQRGHGFAGGEGGQVWITTDGGWTWTAGPNLGRTVLGVDAVGDGHN